MHAIHKNSKSVTAKSSFSTVLFLAALLSFSSACLASTVTLQWEPETAPELAGYKLYYSTSPDLPFQGAGAAQGASPVDVSSQTTAIISGLDPAQAYYFAVTAYDTAGVESAYSNIVQVQELLAPTVAITSPASDASATGMVSVTASASDNVGVSRLEFYLNGVLQATQTSAPYLISWNTASVDSGSYTLLAKAYDAAGNVGQSESVSVQVVNDAFAPVVSLLGATSGATVHGLVPVWADASDDIAVTKVEFYANGELMFAGNVAPYSYAWDTAALANGSYQLWAKAYDAAGNVGESQSLQLTVSNDNIAPAVAIASLGPGSTLSGAITVSADASDNSAVARVDFYLNGVLQATSTAAPYSFNWNTAALANGSYTLSAKAYDAAGNVGQSAGVTVTVAHPVADTKPPRITFIAPTTKFATGSSVRIAASATDNVAVTRMELLIDGVPKYSVNTSSFDSNWTLAAGKHVITVRAYDQRNVAISSKTVTTY